MVRTWRQSRAGSRTFRFFVSNASRRGFKTSSAWLPSKVFPAVPRTVDTVPLVLTGLATDSASSAVFVDVWDWPGSAPVFAASPSVSTELQKEVIPQVKTSRCMPDHVNMIVMQSANNHSTFRHHLEKQLESSHLEQSVEQFVEPDWLLSHCLKTQKNKGTRGKHRSLMPLIQQTHSLLIAHYQERLTLICSLKQTTHNT